MKLKLWSESWVASIDVLLLIALIGLGRKMIKGPLHLTGRYPEFNELGPNSTRWYIYRKAHVMNMCPCKEFFIRRFIKTLNIYDFFHLQAFNPKNNLRWNVEFKTLLAKSA